MARPCTCWQRPWCSGLVAVGLQDSHDDDCYHHGCCCCSNAAISQIPQTVCPCAQFSRAFAGDARSGAVLAQLTERMRRRDQADILLRVLCLRFGMWGFRPDRLKLLGCTCPRKQLCGGSITFAFPTCGRQNVATNLWASLRNLNSLITAPYILLNTNPKPG